MPVDMSMSTLPHARAMLKPQTRFLRSYRKEGIWGEKLCRERESLDNLRSTLSAATEPKFFLTLEQMSHYLFTFGSNSVYN